jgi:hypothetical protein
MVVVLLLTTMVLLGLTSIALHIFLKVVVLSFVANRPQAQAQISAQGRWSGYDSLWFRAPIVCIVLISERFFLGIRNRHGR